MSKAILVRVPDEVYRQLDEIRKKKGKLSVPEVVRDAISDYLSKELFLECGGSNECLQSTNQG